MVTRVGCAYTPTHTYFVKNTYFEVWEMNCFAHFSSIENDNCGSHLEEDQMHEVSAIV